jgi:hypothetical protein
MIKCNSCKTSFDTKDDLNKDKCPVCDNMVIDTMYKQKDGSYTWNYTGTLILCHADGSRFKESDDMSLYNIIDVFNN